MRKRTMVSGVMAAGLMVAVAGCTNPYDPGQRAVGGATGAVAGAATTPAPPPPPPPRPYYYNPY